MDIFRVSPFLSRKGTEAFLAKYENKTLEMALEIVDEIQPKNMKKELRDIKYKLLSLALLRRLKNNKPEKIESASEIFLKEITLIAETLIRKIFSLLKIKDICMMAVGKLGAGELNFSSDIDIIFVRNNYTDEVESTKTVKNIINIISDVTEDGILYRCDLDLRPGGRKSPLCPSEEFFSWYYLNFGSTDDRYALLRMRYIAGDEEIARRCSDAVEPFIWRKYLDFSAVERLREIKKMLKSNIKRQTEIFDVKFSDGGIRDVEFITSSHQILFGGNYPSLRTNSTIKVLEEMQKISEIKITPKLKSAYLFLRDVENVIQMENDEHKFTFDEPSKERYSILSGLLREEVEEVLKSYRKLVTEIFDEIFEVEREEVPIIPKDISESEVKSYLEKLNFPDADSSSKIVRELFEKAEIALEKKYISYTEESSKSEFIVSSYIKEASKSLSPTASLSNFSRFIQRIGRRRSFYITLYQNPKLIKILAKLFGTSNLFSNFICQHPELLDSLLLTKTEDEDLKSEAIERVEGKPYENALDEIRIFSKEKILRLLLEDFSKELSPAEVGEKLSQIYDSIFLSATRYLCAPENFSICALGKYGSKELLYGSDADIIFIFFTDGEQIKLEELVRLSQKVISFVSVPTKEGSSLKVDMRLRPSGKAGPLAVSFKSFQQFYLREADFWQKQSLLRIRPITQVKKEFYTFSTDILSKMDLEDAKTEMAKRRRQTEEKLGVKKGKNNNLLNLKFCKGGLQDIEFVVHLLQIQERIYNPNFIEVLELLSKRYEKISQLKEEYYKLRSMEKEIKLKSDSPLEDIFVEETPEIEKMLNRVREIFNKFFV